MCHHPLRARAGADAEVAVDGTAPAPMRDIHAALDPARQLGTFRGSEHFVTRLEGDLGDVIATALGGWLLVGRGVQHVTSHLTLSLNSPSHELRERAGADDEEAIR